MTTYSSARHGRGRVQRRGETRRTGQWKLAYADFLTALMAFFLLMWLSTDSSAAERSAIAAYFSGEQIAGTVLEPSQTGTDLEALLAPQIAQNPAFEPLKHHIRLQSAPNGLRIELTDAHSGSLFSSGANDLNTAGQTLINTISPLLSALPVDIRIEGHTDAFKTAPGAPTNWEISSARANSTLKALQAGGLSANRFKSVTGLGDTQPLFPNQPHAAINRRISIVLELSEKRALSR